MTIKKITATLLFCAFTSILLAQENSLYEKKEFVKAKDTLLYRILYPENFNQGATYPVVLFLHGAGERGSDNEKQLMHGSGLFTDASNRNDFPAIVIFPQCPKDDYWSKVTVNRDTSPVGLDFQYEKGPTKPLALVMALMEDIQGQNYVNRDQVYVMGLSMGGMGTYELLFRRPDVFTAAAAICGAGDPKSVEKYAAKIPLWAFHGAKDNVVDPQHSLTMVSAILKAGGSPSFTLYDNANHNSWDPAFAEPEFLAWLFSHSRQQ